MKNKLLIPFLILVATFINTGIYSIHSQSPISIERAIYGAEYIDKIKLSEKMEKLLINKDKSQAATGRYSNITADKKIQWNKNSDDYNFDLEKKDMFEKITINNKKITFPLTITDLSNDYKDFNSVDYTKIKSVLKKLEIKNIKNNYIFYASYVSGIVDSKAELNIEPSINIDVVKGNEYIMNIFLNPKDKNIEQFSTSDLGGVLGTADIRVDNIGVGNTFNEMYTKFGKPTSVYNAFGITSVRYSYIDSNKNYYSVDFTHEPKLINGLIRKNKYVELPTKPNVITEIRISFSKGK